MLYSTTVTQINLKSSQFLRSSNTYFLNTVMRKAKIVTRVTNQVMKALRKESKTRLSKRRVGR